LNNSFFLLPLSFLSFSFPCFSLLFTSHEAWR
jgi:hypothetical protein